MGHHSIDALIEADAGPAMNVRVYAATPGRGSRLVLLLHGGAFSGGTLNDADCAAELLTEAGAVVVSADYPAARPFPEGVEATFGVLQSLHRTRGRWAGKSAGLFVAGAESGGNLAAVLALMARDRRGPKLAGQILMSPMLDAGMATCSIRDADAGAATCKWAMGWRQYLGSPDKASHPYAAPASATRLTGLAPALVLTSADDPMRDESLAYARRLAESGVVVRTCTIAAATRWPDGLTRPAPDGAEWSAQVHHALTDFFAVAH